MRDADNPVHLVRLILANAVKMYTSSITAVCREVVGDVDHYSITPIWITQHMFKTERIMKDLPANNVGPGMVPLNV